MNEQMFKKALKARDAADRIAGEMSELIMKRAEKYAPRVKGFDFDDWISIADRAAKAVAARAADLEANSLTKFDLRKAFAEIDGGQVRN
jgi:hypothetical protein